MRKDKILELIEKYSKQVGLFKNRDALSESYLPDTILHRDKEIEELIRYLIPLIRGERAPNIMIFGKPGTGKTLTVKYVLRELEKYAKGKFKYIYVNVRVKRVADTEYRILAFILRKLGTNVPYTGLSLTRLSEMLLEKFEKIPGSYVIVLDEIDEFIKRRNKDALSNLVMLLNEVSSSKVCVIGISNDLFFTRELDSKIKTFFNIELYFKPYDANQLYDILKQRAELAFIPGVISDDILRKIAAIAARNDGDAREAISLLRTAGEIAERKGKDKITIEDVDEAAVELEEKRLIFIINSLPEHSKILLKAILLVLKNKKIAYTGEVYNKYKALCDILGYTPLTQRRISDLIGELDMLGIINATVISRGKHGRTREIRIDHDDGTIEKISHILNNSLNLTDTLL